MWHSLHWHLHWHWQAASLKVEFDVHLHLSRCFVATIDAHRDLCGKLESFMLTCPEDFTLLRLYTIIARFSYILP